ncbi:MAG: cation:proton antiporter, partial [Duncaniella sp.]|nr:cation:proton antiporter [Duncaniella sp.]
IVSMGLCLGMAVFSVACGFSLALGAFVMGSILAGTSFAERIERITTPVKDLFGSVFFISVGMMVSPGVIAEYWVPILILSGVVIVGMIFFGTFGMLLTGQTLRVALESGFSLTQIGEFAFIIATLGMSLGVLDHQIYPIIVAVSVLTTFTTPYFIRMADPAYRFIESHLPRRLHFLIDRYTETATAEQSVAKELWKSLFSRYLWRVILYTIVLIALTIIAEHFIIPFFVGMFPSWGRLLASMISLSVMSPFLLALTYPASKKTERERLRACNARFDVPLIAMTVVRLMIAMAIIVYFLGSVYSIAVGWTLGVALFLIMILSFSRRIKNRLERIETRFIDNLNERELRKTGAKNNLVANMHLAYMTVSYDCPFVGEQLRNSGLRSQFGVSVSSIQRGNHLIMVPGADARLFPGDILGVIGTDEEIQNLIPVIEAESDGEESIAPDDVKLTSVRLTDDSPVVNKTVASSSLAEDYEALLVAVQRDGDYVQPSPDLMFHPGDVLWVVGDIHKIQAIG